MVSVKFCSGFFKVSRGFGGLQEGFVDVMKGCLLGVRIFSERSQ